jgi:hypothetical protein
VTTRALPRTGPRQPGDFVIGCGIPAEGQTSGRSCASAGTELSCQLCPDSPNYWRLTAGGKPVTDVPL